MVVKAFMSFLLKGCFELPQAALFIPIDICFRILLSHPISHQELTISVLVAGMIVCQDTNTDAFIRCSTHMAASILRMLLMMAITLLPIMLQMKQGLYQCNATLQYRTIQSRTIQQYNDSMQNNRNNVEYYNTKQ